MRNFLAFIGAAILVFFGVGLYLGWYHIYREPSPTPGHSRIQVDIDNQKMGTDVKNGAAKVKDAIDKATTDPNAPASPATTATEAPKRDLNGKLIREAYNDGWTGPVAK